MVVSGPVGAQAGARQPPDFFGIGLEERLKQPATKPLRYPLFKRVSFSIIDNLLNLGECIIAQDVNTFGNSQTANHVQRSKRIIEQPIVIENSRQPLYGDDVRIKYIDVELSHLIVLRKESMWPDIEKTSFVFDRPSQPADLVQLFQDGNGRALASQFIGCREPRRSCTDD